MCQANVSGSKDRAEEQPVKGAVNFFEESTLPETLIVCNKAIKVNRVNGIGQV